jgi:pSer/pThr/pTyr-binding forkhead associated (FHA) protein
MPITVIVRVTSRRDATEETRLTFDGTQRVVIGRGAGSDVRLPEPSVSHRHASLRAQGSEFALVDEGSTNGTYVGDVRIAPRTSRVVRNGDRVRVGRIWLELRIDQSPATRDVAAATRDLALALVSQVMAAVGTDPTPRVRVVEGRDQGQTLPLTEDGRVYVVGRAPQCELSLDDSDASREHIHVTRRGGVVHLRDLGAKNGSFLGEARIPDDREIPWRGASVVRIGRTVLALDEPVSQALAVLERAPDEPIGTDEASAPVEPAPEAPPAPSSPAAAPVAAAPGNEPPKAATARRTRGRWSIADRVVMVAAVTVLALSLAGLVWLLRG